ncbi:MurR/RpiR family transcriptional regulator [Salinicoccus roseus]|uniref:MurR/RpiR family transcriptional regulator n=1 Tax=Salinicoccus roseus TaxID=45670 RepID=UPI000F4EEA60|nr:MurR/RpiR family transcriptional regulator [Salinicoccus roseus]RPE54726.1 RpiR family transcriptional regulator [Salinicoccus roseus]GGA63164.1 RpiR family transcriptional regulator [Salinicoccus roseus]
MTENLKATIRLEQYKNGYTKSELKIYDYIVGHTDLVIYHSLTELAEACEVGEATVLRFFRKIGYKGFQEFKFSLAKEVDEEDEEENEESYVFKVKRNMVNAIENSYHVIEKDELEKAIGILDRAKHIVAFGVGASSIATLDMQNRLLRIGKNIEVFGDPHSQVMRTASMDSETAVVAISITGSTKDTVDSIAAAKQKGASVVAITNYSKSPLTKHADCILKSAAKENPLDSGSLTSKVSQLFVIDLICTGLTIKNFKMAEETKLDISENISDKLY